MRQPWRRTEAHNSASPPTSVMTSASILISGTGIHTCFVLLLPFHLSSGQNTAIDIAVSTGIYIVLLFVITLSGLLAFLIKRKGEKTESSVVAAASLTASVPYFFVPASLLFTEPISLPLLAAPLFLGLVGYFLQWMSMRLFVVFDIHPTIKVLAVTLPIVLICLQVFGAA